MNSFNNYDLYIKNNYDIYLENRNNKKKEWTIERNYFGDIIFSFSFYEEKESQGFIFRFNSYDEEFKTLSYYSTNNYDIIKHLEDFKKEIFDIFGYCFNVNINEIFDSYFNRIINEDFKIFSVEIQKEYLEYVLKNELEKDLKNNQENKKKINKI